jgi:hypothetical protein
MSNPPSLVEEPMAQPAPGTVPSSPASLAEAVVARQTMPVAIGGSALLQVDPELPAIDAVRSLIGWRREFCVELLGDGRARIFVRAVRLSSFKATELQRAVLFHRLDVRFTNLVGCVAAMQSELEHLAATARRSAPSRENLFVSVAYDRSAWERVEQCVERWARRSQPRPVPA